MGRLAGHTDAPLHQEGVQELESIRITGIHDSHSVVFVSDLDRAVRTAEILFAAPGVAFRKNPGFREIHFGSDENADLSATDTQEYFHRFMNNALTNGGENYRDFQARVSRAFDDAIAMVRNEAREEIGIVAHFGVLRAILIRLGVLEPKDFFRSNIPNGLGYRLELVGEAEDIRVLWREEIKLPPANGRFVPTRSLSAEAVFRSLASEWGAASATISRAWTELKARYAEPHRRYHTLDHIERMLGFLETAQLQRPTTAYAAALYHDAIYRIGSHRNEEESAELAERELAVLGADEGTRRACVALILLTKDHRLPEQPPSAGQEDAAVFLDADLAVLASDEEEYDDYRGRIRDEFAVLDERGFFEGRRNFLRQMLLPTPLFHSFAFQKALEERARHNLQYELQQVDKKMNLP